MILALSFLEPLKTVLVHAAPGMPPDYWWVTALVLAILILAATIDAFTALVPDGLIFLGLLAVAGTQGLVVSWEVAALHVRQALEAGLLIWIVNFAWYRAFGYDTLGMGDAKWTMLAVACFGITPALFAWGVGAIMASIFIGAAWLARFKVTQVTFAPFLFIGLCIGLYWVRFLAA